MALVPEDGTGLANADCYQTVAEVVALLTDLGRLADWTALATSTPIAEGAIRAAADFVDQRSEEWSGFKKTAGQRRAFPRLSCYDSEGDLVDPDSVPWRVKKAEAIAALEHLSSGPLDEVVSLGGALSAVSVGPISVDFADASAVGEPRSYDAIDLLLGPLMEYGPGVVRLNR